MGVIQEGPGGAPHVSSRQVKAPRSLDMSGERPRVLEIPWRLRKISDIRAVERFHPNDNFYNYFYDYFRDYR